MSNVTLSVVVPSVDIIFDDDTAAILTSVDADTVLGVTPGAIGLQILAATTGDGVLNTIGGASVTMASSLARQAVEAHSSQRNPHREYATQDQINQFAVGNQSLIAAHASAPGSHPDRPNVGQVMSLTTSALSQITAHATAPASHPDRPTYDQAIYHAAFFGG